MFACNCGGSLQLVVFRYVAGADWVPRKLQVSIDVPMELDLSSFTALPLGPEEELVEAGGNSSPAAVQPDAAIVEVVAALGFGPNACARAAVAVNNSSGEAAVEW